METCNVIFHLSFPGGAGLFPLLIGKGYAIQNYLKKEIPHASFLYSGISSGCFVALLLALNFSEKEIHALIAKYLISPIEKKWYIMEQFHIWFLLKQTLRQVIGKDGHTQLNGIFRLGVAKLTGKFKFEKRIIDSFSTSEDLVHAILTSCHLPLLGRHPLKFYRNFWAVDGGMGLDHIQTKDLPKSIQNKTITFRIGYDDFPPQLLSFPQAMPLLTKAKWHRMYEEGKLCFVKKTYPQLTAFFERWWIPSFPGTDKCRVRAFIPHFPLLLDKQRKTTTSLPNKKKISFTPTIGVAPMGGADQIIRGIATGWVEVLAGYLVWSLLFTWNFILNKPF